MGRGYQLWFLQLTHLHRSIFTGHASPLLFYSHLHCSPLPFLHAFTSVSLSRQTRPSVYHLVLDMSTLLLFVVTIAVLCFTTAEFAIYVIQAWNRRTELRSGLRLLFHPVLSAVLIILATLLLLCAGNEADVPILLVSLCTIGSISLV